MEDQERKPCLYALFPFLIYVVSIFWNFNEETYFLPEIGGGSCSISLKERVGSSKIKEKQYGNRLFVSNLTTTFVGCLDLTASFGLSANQPAVLFSHTKSAPATNYQPVSSTVLS